MAIRRKLMGIAESQQKRKLVTTEPNDWRFTYDEDILLRGWRRFEATGVMPTPEEVARVPKRFEDEVFQMGHLLQFQIDAIADE